MKPPSYTGFVYFITARELGRVKIGHSFDPAKRCNALQTGSSVRLALEAMLEGRLPLERIFHNRFAEYRIAGEWFHLVPEIEALMAEHRVSSPYREHPIRPTDLAARMGWSVAYASQILNHRRGSLEISVRVFDTTGIRLGSLEGAPDEDIAVLRKYVVPAAAQDAAA